MPVPSALEPASGWPLRSSLWPREPVRVGRRLRRFPVTGRGATEGGGLVEAHQYDTCVIGAGPAGLAVARALAERNLPYTHYERHTGQGGIRDIDNRAATSVLPTQSRPFSHSCRCRSYGRSLLPHTAEAGPRSLTPAGRCGVPPLGQLFGGWGRPRSRTTSDSGGRICDDGSKVLVLRRR
jgi:NAD(P)-binding Rossmann-like domain